MQGEMLPANLTGLSAAAQVTRVVLEAPGWTGRLCAPREMVVESLVRSQGGVHVVLFSSKEVSGWMEHLRFLAPPAASLTLVFNRRRVKGDGFIVSFAIRRSTPVPQSVQPPSCWQGWCN